MAMAGVLAKADVCDHHQIELGAPNALNGALHHAAGRRSLRPALIFVFRYAEKHDRGNSQPLDFAALLHQLIGGLLVDSGHGTNFHARALARPDKHRVDEATRGEARFARHAPQGLGTAQPPRSLGWKCHAASSYRAGVPRLSRLVSSAVKWRSSPATKDAVVASSASIATGSPAPRIAPAVTGPTAANANRELCLPTRSGPISF